MEKLGTMIENYTFDSDAAQEASPVSNDNSCDSSQIENNLKQTLLDMEELIRNDEAIDEVLNAISGVEASNSEKMCHKHALDENCNVLSSKVVTVIDISGDDIETIDGRLSKFSPVQQLSVQSSDKFHWDKESSVDRDSLPTLVDYSQLDNLTAFSTCLNGQPAVTTVKSVEAKDSPVLSSVHSLTTTLPVPEVTSYQSELPNLGITNALASSLHYHAAPEAPLNLSADVASAGNNFSDDQVFFEETNSVFDGISRSTVSDVNQLISTNNQKALNFGEVCVNDDNSNTLSQGSFAISSPSPLTEELLLTDNNVHLSEKVSEVSAPICAFDKDALLKLDESEEADVLEGRELLSRSSGINDHIDSLPIAASVQSPSISNCQLLEDQLSATLDVEDKTPKAVQSPLISNVELLEDQLSATQEVEAKTPVAVSSTPPVANIVPTSLDYPGAADVSKHVEEITAEVTACIGKRSPVASCSSEIFYFGKEPESQSHKTFAFEVPSLDPIPINAPDAPVNAAAVPVSTPSDYVAEPSKDVPSWAVPWISTDEAENADNNDPNWEIFKKLETDEDRYRIVRERWRQLEIPDPRRDLTRHNFGRKHTVDSGRSSNNAQKLIGIQGKSRKRARSDGIDPNEHPSKRRRMLSCTQMFDDRILYLRQQLDEDFTALQENHRKELHSLSIIQQQEQTRCLNSSAPRYRVKKQMENLHNYQLQQVDNLRMKYDDKMDEISKGKMKTISLLTNASKEVFAFNKFYTDLKSADDDHCNITEEEVMSFEETEAMYEYYDEVYRD